MRETCRTQSGVTTHSFENLDEGPMVQMSHSTRLNTKNKRRKRKCRPTSGIEEDAEWRKTQQMRLRLEVEHFDNPQTTLGKISHASVQECRDLTSVYVQQTYPDPAPTIRLIEG